jgi:hypothetical protein
MMKLTVCLKILLENKNPPIKGMNLGASPEPLVPPQAAGYVSLKGIKED